MKLLVIGVNHKTAPIALREQLAFSHDEMSIALQQLQSFVESSVILSTCNRTEIYLLLADNLTNDFIKKGTSQRANSSHYLTYHELFNDYMHTVIEQLKNWLASYKKICLAKLEPYLYIYYNQQALTHWVRVASGLDSMILGEPQILGQLKQAVNQSLEQGVMSKKFSWIIDQIFSCAKQVRHETQVGSQAVSLGFATAKLALETFDELSNRHLLVIATGEMNRLVATHIVGQNIGKITLCNRNLERANNLAEELTQINTNCLIEVRPFSELAECLTTADIVSSCSGCVHTLVDFDTAKKYLQHRFKQKILMVDLAVPRDIEDNIKDLENVELYSIDDLQDVIADNLQQRKQSAVEAEILISQLVVDIESKFQVRQVGSDISRYRQTAYQHSDKLLAKSLQKLQQGEPAEAVLTELSRCLTQTLIHAPSKLMRTVAWEGDSDTLDIVITGLNNAYRRKKR
ncbi:MAG: glutamyl-tRNA reductase [Moraxellaceae bacterium]|nr:glutamyl-tRNA reductase [Moraxellaceae bacterium]